MDKRSNLIELIAHTGQDTGDNHPVNAVCRGRIAKLTEYLPHGSGIDGTNRIVKWGLDKIVISTEYHHMSEHGFYDGWTNHNIVVTPVFGGIEINVSGRDRNDVKEYLRNTFYAALTEVYELARKDDRWIMLR